MPQKKSSQLYSVSPKSFVRKPKKKRKVKTGFLLPVLSVLFCLALIALGYYLYSMHASGVISPLQVAVGQKLQSIASDRGEAGLKRLLVKHAILYTSVASSQDDYVITLNAKQQVIVTKQKDIGSQISSLQVILPRLTMEGREFRRLDMRFDKPVVTY